MSKIDPKDYKTQKELDVAHRKRAQERRYKNRENLTYYGKPVETEDNVQYGSGSKD